MAVTLVQRATGPEDVVFLGENARVRLVTTYPAATPGRTGRYMIHGHITTHEDHDMMLQFRVGAETPATDPIDAARPLPLRRPEPPTERAAVTPSSRAPARRRRRPARTPRPRRPAPRGSTTTGDG